MNRWILSTCLLLLAPGLSRADGVPPADPGDPVAARFERALAARVDEVLGERVDVAAERALALLEAREAERPGEAARAPARRAERGREGAEGRVRVAEPRRLAARETDRVRHAVALDLARSGSPALPADGAH
jgi:hypothetical protein